MWQPPYPEKPIPLIHREDVVKSQARILKMVESWKSIMNSKLILWSKIDPYASPSEYALERTWLMDNHYGGFVCPWPGVDYYCNSIPVMGPKFLAIQTLYII